MKDISSARLLLKATRNLGTSLSAHYEVSPDNPETDFLIAAAQVASLSKIVFKDLVSRQGSEICASWALDTAIALEDYENAERFLDEEIRDMKQEGLDLSDLVESTKLSLSNHWRSGRWNDLILRIEEAAET